MAVRIVSNGWSKSRGFIPLFFILTMSLPLALLNFSVSEALTTPQSLAVYPGDVHIGLFVPVFERDPKTGECRNYDNFRGGEFLVAEAFLQSIVRRHRLRIGDEEEMAPRIGFVLMDTCHSVLKTVSSALAAGAKSMKLMMTELPMGGDIGIQRELLKSCNHRTVNEVAGVDSSNVRAAAAREGVAGNYAGLSALIGPTTGDTVLDVSQLLSAFHIPHIVSPGPGSSAKNFIPVCDSAGQSDMDRLKPMCQFEYDYLFRVVPPEEHVTDALLDVMATFGWSHVVVLVDTESQAANKLGRFMKEVERRNRANTWKTTCVAFTAIVPDSPAETVQLDSIVEGLKRHTRAQVVLMIARATPALVLFNHIVKRNKKIPRVWLATEWGKDYLIFKNQTIIDTTLSTMIRLWPDIPVDFQPLTRSLMQDFSEHLSSLTYKKVYEEKYNPWLCLNWGTAFGCRGLCQGKFDGVCVATNGDFTQCMRQSGKKFCDLADNFTINIDPNELYLSSASHTAFSSEIAVEALKSLWRTTLQRYPNASRAEQTEEFVKSANSGGLVKALTSVRLPCGLYLASRCRVFKEESSFHSVVPSYSLMVSEKLTMKRIGSWELDNQAERNKVQLVESHRDYFNWDWMTIDNETGYPLSDCRRSCKVGEIKKSNVGLCCWTCTPCTGNNYTENNHTCKPCPHGKLASSLHTHCVPLPRAVFVPQWYVGAALTGTLVFLILHPVLGSIIALIWKRQTMAIKSADPHLTLIMAVGMLFAALSLAVLYLPPSKLTCSLARVLVVPWLLLTVVTLLMKTLRLTRLWLSTKKGERVNGKWTLATSAQFIYISLITIIGSVLEIALSFGLGSDVEERFTVSNTYLICKQSLSQLFNDILILLLVLSTCVLAFVIRKMPTMANESQKLFLAAFCISTVWLLLTPVYYLSSDYLSTILSMRAIGQIFSMWAWIILPRLYFLKDSKHRMKMRRQNSSLVRSIIGGSDVASNIESGRQSADRQTFPQQDAVASPSSSDHTNFPATSLDNGLRTTTKLTSLDSSTRKVHRINRGSVAKQAQTHHRPLHRTTSEIGIQSKSSIEEKRFHNIERSQNIYTGLGEAALCAPPSNDRLATRQKLSSDFWKPPHPNSKTPPELFFKQQHSPAFRQTAISRTRSVEQFTSQTLYLDVPPDSRA